MSRGPDFMAVTPSEASAILRLLRACWRTKGVIDTAAGPMELGRGWNITALNRLVEGLTICAADASEDGHAR